MWCKILMLVILCNLYLGMQHMWILPQPIKHIKYRQQRTFAIQGTTTNKSLIRAGDNRALTHTPKIQTERQVRCFLFSQATGDCSCDRARAHECARVYVCLTERKVCKKLRLWAQFSALIIQHNSFLTLTSSPLSLQLSCTLPLNPHCLIHRYEPGSICSDVSVSMQEHAWLFVCVPR